MKAALNPGARAFPSLPLPSAENALPRASCAALRSGLAGGMHADARGPRRRRADVADAAEVASFVLSQRLSMDSVDVKVKTLKLINVLAHKGQQPGRPHPLRGLILQNRQFGRGQAMIWQWGGARGETRFTGRPLPTLRISQKSSSLVPALLSQLPR